MIIRVVAGKGGNAMVLFQFVFQSQLQFGNLLA
jgi:hypothetical protein